jgi:tetratricopeptide (TPR) repeat protein
MMNSWMTKEAARPSRLFLIFAASSIVTATVFALEPFVPGVSMEVTIRSDRDRSPQAAPKPEPQSSGKSEPIRKDRKQLEADARQLVAEGKTLEQKGNLSQAKDRYVDAEGILSTPEARAAIRRINDEQKTQVETILAEAHPLYDENKFSDAIKQLQHGLSLQPSNPALHYNLSLGYAKLGDRENAALHLDFAIGALSNGKEREELFERLSSVLMGTAVPDIKQEARNTLSIFNTSYLKEDLDSGGNRTSSVALCEQTKQLKSIFPSDPAVVFNSGKCALEDAHPEDAAHQLADYLKLAPEALDKAEAALHQQDLLSLASLSGDSGQAVRQRFATAARYLDYRRYDRAIDEYERAAQALPDYPQTQWQLSLLYEAFGNVAKAREHLSRFQQLEPDPERTGKASSHLSTLEKRRAVYDANLSESEDIITGLLLPSIGLDTAGVRHKTKLTYRQWRWASHRYKEATRASQKLSQPYVERELDRAREDLESATELFPLGAEANELLALISLQANDWPEAYRSYDAVASQSLPVSFYAQVNSERDNKVVRATKVEIGADAIRLVYLSSYYPKKQVSLPPSKPAGEDDLGNLVVSAMQPPDPDAEALTIRVADLKGIETDKNFVVLKLRNDKIYIAPLNMLSDIPFEGRASRTFGNEYTRLFVRYLGYEEAKLGKEGMTTGEKFKLGFEIARIGVSVGMMGVTGPAAYGSAVRMAQLVHALRVYHSVMQGVRAVDATEAATRLADDVQMAAATLERTANDERRAIEGLKFKIIPTQQLQLKFREKF